MKRSPLCQLRSGYIGHNLHSCVDQLLIAAYRAAHSGPPALQAAQTVRPEQTLIANGSAARPTLLKTRSTCTGALCVALVRPARETSAARCCALISQLRSAALSARP